MVNWKERSVFEQRQKNWIKKLQDSFIKFGDSRETKSKNEIELVKELCKIIKIEVPKTQKYISYNKKHYAYDFEYKNKIIEYNGDYWHCNPKMYSKDFIHRTRHITANEIWKNDEAKIKAAKSFGYDVLVVWESEYLLNKDYVIKKCIKFLNS